MAVLKFCPPYHAWDARVRMNVLAPPPKETLHNKYRNCCQWLLVFSSLN